MQTLIKGKKTMCWQVALLAMLMFINPFNLRAQQSISGTVTDSDGNPIFKANVMEVDRVNRIDHYTTTDPNGLFTMGFTGKSQNYIFVTADGFQTYHRSIGDATQLLKIHLKKRPVSRLSEIRKKAAGTKRRFVKTNKLLCGRSGLQEVPWTTIVEAINDSIFMLQLPVTTINKHATYHEGRTITFLDKNDYHMLLAYNGEEAYPILGNPADDDIWDHMGKEVPSLVFTRDDSDPELSAYFYPQFLFTLSDLQMLCDQADRIGYILVDIETADNYWNYYTLDTFGKELKRILDKLTKTKKK